MCEVLLRLQKLRDWVSDGGPMDSPAQPVPRETTSVGPAPPLPEFYAAPRSGNTLVVASQPPPPAAPPAEPGTGKVTIKIRLLSGADER